MKTALAWTIALALGIGSFLFNLFTFVKIWAIIAVPMGAPAIDQWKAYGIACLIAHFVTPNLFRYKEDKEGDALERMFKYSLVNIIASLFSWGFVSLIFG